MTKTTEITSKLWEMANKLRGTMDASEYKNYILPFMFYRYLSEHQDDYLRKNGLEDFYQNPKDIEEYYEDIARSLGYVIEPQFTWNAIVDSIENHKIKASDFQDMFEAFHKHAKRNTDSEQEFANVFFDVNLGDTRLGSGTNERAKALNDIVLMINEFDFKDESGHDILGDVYEYLIGQFAANAGKKGGEFYTPHEVSQILARLVTDHVAKQGNQFRVYDPTMGSGSLLLTVQRVFSGSDISKVEFYGQELNTTTYNLARMNLMMHGVSYANMNLKRADTLDADWPFTTQNGIEVPKKFDAVVANPPYSQNWDIKNIDREKDVRFKGFGVAPASKAERKDVLFIDASKEFEKGKNKNTLSEENINKIVETYHNREDVDKYAHVATIEEIKENDYNLNIPRYVDTFEEEEVVPLTDIAKELNDIQTNIDETTKSLMNMLNDLVGTTPEAQSELEEFRKLFSSK